MKKNLRKYQELIIDNKPFQIYFDEKIYVFVCAQVNGDSNKLFFQKDSEIFQIESGEAGNAYLLSSNISATREDNVGQIGLYQIDKCCVVVGHWNFAHFLWNQLSAFYLKGVQQKLHYCFIREPISDPAKILNIEAEFQSKIQNYLETLSL